MSRSFAFGLEQLPEEPGDFAPARLHGVRHLAPVEPDSVSVGAPVELDLAELHGRKLRPAAHAGALAGSRRAGGLQLPAHGRRVAARPVDDLLQLPRVQPGALARDAVVRLDPLVLERDQDLSAGGAHVWIIMTAGRVNRYMQYRVDYGTVLRAGDS